MVVLADRLGGQAGQDPAHTTPRKNTMTYQDFLGTISGQMAKITETFRGS